MAKPAAYCRYAVLRSIPLLYCVILLQACETVAPPQLPDTIRPRTVAIPAGGIYHTLPEQIRLLGEAGATIHYHWQDEKTRQYTGPIRPPVSGAAHVTLHYWAQDAAGNRERLRREHYVIAPQAAPVDILEIDRPVLGRTETAMLRWRSMAADATYEIAVTSSGWGPGRLVAQGLVTPGAIQQTSIPAAALFPGENRLWLRVTGANDVTGATSRRLLLHAVPATTHAWPAGGRFGTAQTVWLFAARPAIIYYTTDGSTPTLTSSRYTTALHIDRTTRLRYFSVDAYGNREETRESHYQIDPQTPSLTLQTVSSFDAGGDTPVTFTWRSDTSGRYDVVLQPPYQRRAITVQQGNVRRQEEIHSRIARNFLTVGGWQVQVRVRPSQGQDGWLAFRLRVGYLETFADTRYLDTETTFAAWDTTQRHARLTRGPRLLGTYPTRGRSRQVTTRGPYAYLANGKGGLHIVEVSDPQTPRRAGVFYPQGSAVALAKYRNYVYLAAGRSGIAILDVTNATAPRLVTLVPLAGSATDIAIVAPYAYVGTQQGILYIFDLTHPVHPHQLGQVSVNGRVVDIAVADDGMVYLACLDRGVGIVDARSPQHPRLLRQWPTRTAATGVAVDGQHVYIAAGTLEVLDVRQPEAPVYQKRQWMQSAYGVTVLPPYVIVAAGTDGIMVVSPDRTGAVYSHRTMHYAARLTLHDSHLLVADTRGGLQIFDVTKPAQPQRLAGLENIGPVVDVNVDGNLAYLATDRNGSGLIVVDLSTPAAPRVIGRYHHEATSDIVLWNDLALVSDESGVFQVLDIQQPSRPHLLASLPLTGKAQRLALMPPYALVASDREGMHVVALTQPNMPERLTTVSMPGRALDIVLIGRTAYIATVSGGIQIVDVSTPAEPKFVGAYHHPDGESDHIIRLLAHEKHVYAIDSERGLQVLGLTPSGQLEHQSSLEMPQGAPWALAAVGPYLFITTLLNSLYVVEITNPLQPHLLGMVPYGGAGMHASGPYLYIAVRGSQGVPGGLRIVETFASVPQNALSPLRALGVPILPGPTSATFLVNRVHTFNSPSMVQSTVLSAPDIAVLSARLHVEDFWHMTGHIRYQLSNDGGTHWDDVQPGEWLPFTNRGSDLRWRATLMSADLTTTPVIDAVRIDYTIPNAPHPTPRQSQKD